MKHINIIAKSFNINKKDIKENIKIDKFNWDSLTKIKLISYINEKYSKNIDHRKFEKVTNFKDINNLIEETLKNE
tara:strand:+ start:101 stop:325 length:225 start_codon:yes stop_codon:yes gene_type:complete